LTLNAALRKKGMTESVTLEKMVEEIKMNMIAIMLIWVLAITLVKSSSGKTYDSNELADRYCAVFQDYDLLNSARKLSTE